MIITYLLQKILIMKKVRILLVMCTILLMSESNAQQQVQFTQYMYNTMMVNPAYAGTGSQLEALFIHRSQWVGLAGAPQTQNVGVHGAAGKIMGVGLNFTNDRIGPANQSFLTASLAARIKLSEKIKLSVGLNGGMDFVNVDWSKGQAQSENDAAMMNNIRNRVRPVFGAGVYLYADNWYFGVSSPTFIQRDRYGDGDEASINNTVHWYAIAGYVFNIGDNVKLKPAVMTKIVKGAPITADVSLNTLIKEQFTVGLGYRYHDAMSILLGYTLKRMLFIGYSYDINLTKLRGYNSGSHDIILKYNLVKKDVAARSPRFF
jgi:type IX secretion system PorP/SprF family membrane protein